MRHERQVELLERIAAAGAHLQGLHAPSSATSPSSTYTDPALFERELSILFREGPTFFALSCEIPDPGCFLADTVGGVPLAVIRQTDKSLRALVNACRHRGAPVLAPGSRGERPRSITCPYHGWVYDLDGKLRARPLTAGAFDDVAMNCDLHEVAVAEKYGMIFVRAGGSQEIDVDAYLAGAEDDLRSFDLGRYTHIERRTRTWRMNWKLAVDTFTESYHIRTLHQDTLAPHFDSDCLVFEPFGPNMVAIGLRKNVRDETTKPKEDWSLLPYGTIQYFLIPGGLIVHQLDHIETWRIEPIDVRTSRLTTSIHAPTAPAGERERAHWLRNLDLLLEVTGREDFPLMESIQSNLDSGALTEVVYGRNEAALIHFHRALGEALGG